MGFNLRQINRGGRVCEVAPAIDSRRLATQLHFDS
jgi:hypothetical protein